MHFEVYKQVVVCAVNVYIAWLLIFPSAHIFRMVSVRVQFLFHSEVQTNAAVCNRKIGQSVDVNSSTEIKKTRHRFSRCASFSFESQRRCSAHAFIWKHIPFAEILPHMRTGEKKMSGIIPCNAAYADNDLFTMHEPGSK